MTLKISRMPSYQGSARKRQSTPIPARVEKDPNTQDATFMSLRPSSFKSPQTIPTALYEQIVVQEPSDCQLTDPYIDPSARERARLWEANINDDTDPFYLDIEAIPQQRSEDQEEQSSSQDATDQKKLAEWLNDCKDRKLEGYVQPEQEPANREREDLEELHDKGLYLIEKDLEDIGISIGLVDFHNPPAGLVLSTDGTLDSVLTYHLDSYNRLDYHRQMGAAWSRLIFRKAYSEEIKGAREEPIGVPELDEDPDIDYALDIVIRGEVNMVTRCKSKSGMPTILFDREKKQDSRQHFTCHPALLRVKLMPEMIWFCTPDTSEKETFLTHLSPSGRRPAWEPQESTQDGQIKIIREQWDYQIGRQAGEDVDVESDRFRPKFQPKGNYPLILKRPDDKDWRADLSQASNIPFDSATVYKQWCADYQPDNEELGKEFRGFWQKKLKWDRDLQEQIDTQEAEEFRRLLDPDQESDAAPAASTSEFSPEEQAELLAEITNSDGLLDL